MMICHWMKESSMKVGMEVRMLALVGVLGGVMLAGCGGGGSGSEAVGDGSGAAGGWLLSSEPAGAVGVAEAKASASEGERVVVRARGGGGAKPISSESPVFLVMDLSVPYCGQETPERCPQPWDYCCETPEVKRAKGATVQVVDASGEPIDESLAVAGVAPLDEVVIVGTVGARPSPEVLTIRAEGVYRVGG